MVRPLDNVINDPWVKLTALCPLDPLSCISLHLNVEHSVDQGRRHGFDNGRVLNSVSGTNDNAAFREVIFADSSFVNKRIESFLNFLGTGIEFIKK